MATIAARAPRPFSRPELLGLAGLLVLGFLPAVVCVFRLAQIVGGVSTPEIARFIASPAPMIVHVVCAVPYYLFGAAQFSTTLRVRYPRWHKLGGRALVLAGLGVALSGIWMTLVYPISKPDAGLPAYDTLGVFGVRLLVGAGMAYALVKGVTTIRQGDVAAHRAWMARAYALAMGAGTQVLTHIPWFLFPELRGELARTVMMAGAWALNLAVAEWYIARHVQRSGRAGRLQPR